VKRDVLDAVISDLVRERDDWTCQYSGRIFPDRKGQDVHCSHFYSRSYISTRWHPDNMLCLSAGAHDFVGKNPDAHVALIKRVLGDARYEALQARKNKIFRYRGPDKKAMLKHYRSELERLLALRASGVTGRIEVVSYD
jgi:hypothetical protein